MVPVGHARDAPCQPTTSHFRADCEMGYIVPMAGALLLPEILHM